MSYICDFIFSKQQTENHHRAPFWQQAEFPNSTLVSNTVTSWDITYCEMLKDWS